MSKTELDADHRPSEPSFWRSFMDRGSYVFAGVALTTALVQMSHLANGVWLFSVRLFPFQMFHGIWAVVSIGLAFFCLGLGAAYVVFARYRERQTAQLRHDYAGLQLQAESLLKAMQRRHASLPIDPDS